MLECGTAIAHTGDEEVPAPHATAPSTGRAPSKRPNKPLKLGSCTACRRVKMRCDRGGSDARSQPSKCGRCVRVDLECVYDVHKTGYKVPPAGSVVATVPHSISLSPGQDEQTAYRTPSENALARPTRSLSLEGPSTFSPTSPSCDLSVEADVFERQILPNPIALKPFSARLKRDYLPEEDPMNLGLLTLEQARAHFNFYLLHMHPWSPILNTRLHTFEYVRATSTFLFTIVCLQSSPFLDDEKVSMRLAQQAKKMCGTVFSEGYRSLELVVAFALYAARLPYGEAMDIDKSWTYLGAALRMALELGIEDYGRDSILPESNTARGGREIWIHSRAKQKLCLNLYILDRSMSRQMGRPAMLRDGSPMLASLTSWMNHPATEQFERLTASQVCLRRILEELATTTHESRSAVFVALQQLDNWRTEWYMQSNTSSKCNYHHTRILVLACGEDRLDTNTEKRAEARHIVRLWLNEVVIPNRLLHATTIALVIVSHAVVIMLQTVLCQDGALTTSAAQEDVALTRELLNDMQQAASQSFYGSGTVRFHTSYLRLCLNWFENRVRSTIASSQAAPLCQADAQSRQAFTVPDHCDQQVPLQLQQVLMGQDNLDVLHGALFPGWLNTMAPSQYMGGFPEPSGAMPPVNNADAALADTWADPSFSTWLHDLVQELQEPQLVSRSSSTLHLEARHDF